MNTTKRWIAGLIMVAGLGTAITGTAIASADTGMNSTNSVPGISTGTTPGPVSDGSLAKERQLHEVIGEKIIVLPPMDVRPDAGKPVRSTEILDRLGR